MKLRLPSNLCSLLMSASISLTLTAGVSSAVDGFSINFSTSNKGQLTGDTTAGVDPTAGKNWTNVNSTTANIIQSNNGTELSGVSLTTTAPYFVAPSQDTPAQGNSTLLSAYLDDWGDAYNYVHYTVTITGTPYLVSTVYLIMAGDGGGKGDEGKKFTAMSVNGVNYTGSGTTTSEGIGVWGDRILGQSSLQEGTNYLKVDNITGNQIIIGNVLNNTQGRGTIAGIQVVDAYKGTKHDLNLTANGTWKAGVPPVAGAPAWVDSTATDGTYASITSTATGGSSLTISDSVTTDAVVLTDASTSDLTISGGSLKLTGPGILRVESENKSLTIKSALSGDQVSGNILHKTGAGTINLEGTVNYKGTFKSEAGTTNFKGETTLNSLQVIAGTTNVMAKATLGSCLASGGTTNFRSEVSSTNLYIGNAIVNLESGTNITVNQLRLTEGAGGSVLNVKKGSTLNVTGTNSTYSLNASFMLSNNAGTSYFNVTGGIVNAQDTRMNTAWVGTSVTQVSGGVLNVRDICYWGNGNDRGDVFLGTNATGTASNENATGRINIGDTSQTQIMCGINVLRNANTRLILGRGTIGALADWMTDSDNGGQKITVLSKLGTIFDTSNVKDSTIGHTIILNHSLTGTGKIIKTGEGTLVLNATDKTTLSDFSGGTEINGGTLKANHAKALGTGDVTINGGTLDATNKYLGNKMTIKGGKISNFAKSGNTLKEVSLLATNKDTNKTITIDNSFLQATTEGSVNIGLGNQIIMM
ncbi:MAG: hypothetical protein RR808_09720, partial [Akkermansia sp.]